MFMTLLIENLQDRNPHVRRFIAEALGRMGGAAREAVPALKKRLRDSRMYVRRAALRALLQIDPNCLAAARETEAPAEELAVQEEVKDWRCAG